MTDQTERVRVQITEPFASKRHLLAWELFHSTRPSTPPAPSTPSTSRAPFHPTPKRWHEGRVFYYRDGSIRFIREGYYREEEWENMLRDERRSHAQSPLAI